MNLKNNQVSLSNKLETLSEYLLARNNPTGSYYLSLALKLNSYDSNKYENDLANEILSSSGKIQDLAGFNYKETLILDEICIIAHEIKLQNKV